MLRAVALKTLAALPAAPQQCQSFFVTGHRHRPTADLVAMWMSVKTGLPTLNGYSSLSPPGWQLSGSLVADRVAARTWIEASKLAGEVCLYDEETQRWSPFYPAGDLGDQRAAGQQGKKEQGARAFSP
jgi:hypothetical protein